jgi:predicted anti-sigma-YlaC factor YlaD
MRKRPTPIEPCLWASQRLSLRLDGEISEFEAARLEEHLRSCAECRAFAADLEGLTRTLRGAALETPSVAFELPRRRRAGAVVLRAMSATAAAAVMAISALVGLSGVVTPNLSPRGAVDVDVRIAHERLAVKEQLLDNLEQAGRARAEQIRPSLAGVELVTVGPQRTSGTGLRSRPNEGR